MKKFYLIGENISNSYSPHIHNWIYNFLNIKATYSIQNLDQKEFENKFENILHNINTNKISGINITNPYKRKINSYMISVSNDAKKIDAINSIYKINSQLIGDNTDWYGFLESLKHHNINLRDYNIIIIGAGGASRSIIYSLQINGIEDFQIYNRTKINNIVVNNKIYSTLELKKLERNIIPKTLIINCTPIDVINDIFTKKILKNVKIFYDLNYHQSKFYSILNNQDIQIIEGLDMLIYQAIKSIELWLNKEIISKINVNDIKQYLKEF